MRLLLLGGTVFVGRHIAAAALRRGHDVTLFHRALTNPTLFPEAGRLYGDRNASLAALQGRRWDAVIDTCGYSPRAVAASAKLLANAVEHYTFISTVSVYSDFSIRGIDENAAVAIEERDMAAESGAEYGPSKLLCEQAVEEAMGGRALLLRPGEIVGPHDSRGRFPYWPSRLARGGEVLAPGNPDRPIQFVDARDFAEWTLSMVESARKGVYNIAGPGYSLSLGAFLEECKAAVGAATRFTWVDDSFLLEQGVKYYSNIPFWIPDRLAGLYAIRCERAMAAGLTFRPIADTIRDTLTWLGTLPAGSQIDSRNLNATQEAQLLRAWSATKMAGGQ